MLSTKLLLNNKIKFLSTIKKHDFLINCINKHENVKEIINNEIKIKQLEKQNIIQDEAKDNITDTFCQICETNEFIQEKYQEVCKNCGLVRPLQQQLKTFEQYEYIKPGANIVKIIHNGKVNSVNLDKINTWIQESDPNYREIKIIQDTLDIVYQSKKINLPSSVINSSLSIYLNFQYLIKSIPKQKKIQFNKNAIIALCIYYGASMNKSEVDIRQLSLILDIDMTIINENNSVMKKIFEDTEYIQYFTLTDKLIFEVDLSMKNNILYKKIVEHLKNSNLYNIPEPIDNKYYAAIIYYITNKINVIKKYTLNELYERCHISPPIISKIAKSIERFYIKNPDLYQQLI